MDKELLRKILCYIDAHIQEKISLLELADVAGYSPFYFSKLFAKKMVFEVLRTSLEEAKVGYCTEIQVALLGDGRIKIADNGRGIPLSKDIQVSKMVLEKILAGHPISNMEYAELGDFAGCGMQTVNSLCESLQVTVYRDGMVFQQDYVRGIAQHEIVCNELEHKSGTEMILKPDGQIFGDIQFSMNVLEEWIEENALGIISLLES